MKKQKNKQAKKASKLAKAENLKQKTITVKNAEGEPDTEAVVLVQNKIDYTPKVSVIIPVYNVEQYLRECLNSVIKQTLKEIEIICVDDGSTDNSLSILKEYAEKDHRITIITQKNLHAGVARNAGLAVAKGEYVSFLDSDDFFELNMLEEMYKKATKYKSDITICHVKMYEMNNETITNCLWGLHDDIVGKKDHFKTRDFADKIFQFNQGWVWDKIYKRQFVKQKQLFFQNTRTSNDLLFCFLAFALSTKISIVEDYLLTHRLHRVNSLENSREKSYKSICYAVLAVKRFLEKYNVYNIYKQSFVNYVIGNFIWNYNTLKEPYKTYLLDYVKDTYSNLLNDCKKFYNIENYKKFSSLVRTNSVPESYVKDSIPIFFATNKAYVKPLCTAINSLIAHANECNKYSLFIFHTELQYNDIALIEHRQTNNVRIKCINVSRYIDAAFSYTCAHYSREMYYRIIIANMFPEIDKAVYLDCDIVLQKDVGELYNIYIENYVIGAVINPVVNSKDYIEKLGIDYKKYFNSGVLLINLKKFRDDAIMEQCVSLASKLNNLKFPDQDILNIVLNGKVKFLDVSWNYQWLFNTLNIELPEYCRDEYEKAAHKPNIIHFSGSKKPWNGTINKFANIYYRYSDEKHKSMEFYRTNIENWYLHFMREPLNLDNPRTFNEKIQWLKLYDSTPIKTRLADKYLVRDWVKEKIGEQYLIPLLGVYDKFEDIDFAKLPNQFVIKCNHGSSWNIIVTDKSKLDLNDAKAKLNKWLNSNFAFSHGYELHYRDIEPKIIIEKYIEELGTALYDYRFFCCDGKVQQIWVDVFSGTPQHKRKIYDVNWKELNFTVKWPRLESNIEKPKNLAKMISLAETMAEGFALVRVDFYDVNNRIYFGEMTFTSMSGIGKFSSLQASLKLASKIKLPELAYDLDTGEYYKLEKRNNIKPYIRFFYNIFYRLYLKYEIKKEQELSAENIIKNILSLTHVNIINLSKINNSVEIVKTNCEATKPTWLHFPNGNGAFITSNQAKQYAIIKVNGGGTLLFAFKGRYHVVDSKRYPLWIDYKSIKIDGKEILSAPVATWHDKPFKYEMSVKDGQVVKIAFEQQPHQYAKSELKDVILKLNPNNNYIKTNADKIIAKLAKTYAKPLTLKNGAKTVEVKISPEEVERQKVLNLLQQSLAASQNLSKEISNLKGQIESLQKEVKTLKTEQVTTQKMLVNEQTLLQKRRKLN